MRIFLEDAEDEEDEDEEDAEDEKFSAKKVKRHVKEPTGDTLPFHQRS